MRRRWREWLPPVLMVLAPILLIGWMGWQESAVQQDRLRIQVRSAAEARLAKMVDTLNLWLLSEEDRLASVLGAWKGDVPQALPELVRNNPLFVGCFAVDASGILIWPDTNQLMESKDREFLQRTKALWSGKLSLPWNDAVDESKVVGSVVRKKESSPVGMGAAKELVWRASQQERGWIPWHWEDGLHFLYWQRDGRGGVVGGEVDRIALLSAWIGAAPERDWDNGQFRMLDENEKELHAFGGWTPVDGAVAIASRNLPWPLQVWKLEYRGPEAQWLQSVAAAERRARWWRFGALAFVFCVLVAFYWRESRRAFREARQRVNFVNQVSHELRTPLTNIRLYAELARDGTMEADTEARLKVIQEESERLSRLVSDILAFARDERGTLKVNLVPVDIRQWLPEVLDKVRPSLARRSMALECLWDMPSTTDVWAYMDSDAGTQVLLNLLGNAEKYAQSGEWVGVRVSCVQRQIRLEVSDRGPGIPARLRKKVFAPFFRMSNQVTDGAAGAGIGLSIAKRLAEMMGGSLDLVPNHGKEKGACFVWVVPMANNHKRGDV